MTNDEKAAFVRSKCCEIGEHFETVQIFCTNHESPEEGTIKLSLGSGNWFARYGQVRDWVLREEEGMRIESRKDREE